MTLEGRKKALLIGIESSGSGALRDSYAMRDLLTDVYDYASDEICILVADGIQDHRQPTRANILQAIAELVKDARAGDRIFFHYSGDSTQVINRSNSEKDGVDSCLVPLEGEEMMIVDTELHSVLVAPLPTGVHLVAVLDTCHSAGLLDLEHYCCNRVFVPWTLARSESLEIQNRPVRHSDARIFHLPVQTKFKTPPLQTHVPPISPPRPQTRRSVLSRLGHPPVALGSAPRTYAHVADVPFARLRNSPLGARATSSGPKEGDTSTWMLPEEDWCSEPPPMFGCSGWCRYDSTYELPMDHADVISLAFPRAPQCAEQGQSLASSLVEILRRNPNQSLKNVMTHICHASYSKYAEHSKVYPGLSVTMGQRARMLPYGSELPELASRRPLDMNRPWRM
ncbi:caspase domain-containing protein [Mycena latifolia]|nr:caspase domain-containing protein [Mycena latifolia]